MQMCTTLIDRSSSEAIKDKRGNSHHTWWRRRTLARTKKKGLPATLLRHDPFRANTLRPTFLCKPAGRRCLGTTQKTPFSSCCIEVTYPGNGNNSQFVYDGWRRNVSIVETVSGSVTSTKIVCWVSSYCAEIRNASGTITAQFFSLGETISGTSYPYTSRSLGLSAAYARPFMQLRLLRGHRGGFSPLARSGSVREMTISSGTVQAQYGYDPYGRATLIQGSLASDQQFGGYYFHAPSGLA